MGSRSGSRRQLAQLVLACTSVWLCMPATGHAQTLNETCPPPVSPAAPAVAPSTSSLQPSAQQLLACIGSQPIRGALFRHWTEVARRAEGPRQRRGAPHVRALVQEVMGFLLSSYWVIGEAKDLNVHLSDAQVRRAFDRIRRQQFPKRGEFTSFLRSSGQTVADLLFRVRLMLLSGRLQRQIISAQHGARAQEEALARFVREFKAKWRAQTYCATQYAVEDCGHVQAVL
jgi:hypothetical protein